MTTSLRLVEGVAVPDVADKRARLARVLDAAVSRALTEPMRWGVDDCALWCASVLREALGFDPGQRFRGRYTTARGYLRVLRRDGFACLSHVLGAVAAERQWQSIEPVEALTGDIGVVEAPASCNVAHPDPRRPRRQICVIRRGVMWVGRRNLGVGYLPTEQVTSAWRVVP